MLRPDQIRRWPDLRVAERERLTSRVVLVGAEVSGKTTLAGDLAEHYRSIGGIFTDTQLVPEYRREYILSHDSTWKSEDFARISTEQQRLEDAATAIGSPVLVCDTDALSVTVWERRYLGSRAAHDALPVLPPRALYLLADHTDVPFESKIGDDGLREQMTAWLIEQLTLGGHRWNLLTGSATSRLEQAVRLIDSVLGR